MPLYVRHLPCKPGKVIDDSTLPPNTRMLNPSISVPILYIRAQVSTEIKDVNFILLHNIETKETKEIHKIPLANTVNLYQGIEDLRIQWYKNKLWFTATSTHASKNMQNELLIGYFNKDLNAIEKMSVVDLNTRLPIKNICPFVDDNKLKFLDVYKRNIYELVENEDENEPIKVVNRLNLKPAKNIKWIDEFRGSTTPIWLHGHTWGAVVHDIIYNDCSRLSNAKLSYLHYWMEFNIITGTITFLSTPFWCIKWGIEFVSGINYNYDTNNITLYMGVEDREAAFIVTTLNDLRVGK